MNLVASLIVRNELDRYLRPCIDNLLEFCDKVVILDDYSDDGTVEYLLGRKDDRIVTLIATRARFYEHEGKARQMLLEMTLAEKPTHVLNIDADELVDDGAKVRAALEAEPDEPVWSLQIEEVRTAKPDELLIREDGGWRTHPLNVLWRVTADPSLLKIMDRRLACRRVPTAVWQQRGRPAGACLLHFGWADPAERQKRYDRYLHHDKGRFHARAHLHSIPWKDDDPRMKLRSRPWPQGPAFDLLRLQLLEAA